MAATGTELTPRHTDRKTKIQVGLCLGALTQAEGGPGPQPPPFLSDPGAESTISPGELCEPAAHPTTAPLLLTDSGK